MPYLIDTHSHLNHENFALDLAETVERTLQAGVEKILVAAYDMPSSEQAIKMAEEFDCIAASVGIHPHDAKTMDEHNFARIKELASHPKVLAIGEIGLDFHYNFSPPDKQEEAFRLQVRLAHELDLPIIVHSREAGEETLAVLRSEPRVRGVFHCFSENVEYVKRVVEMGYYIGIDGPVTYKRSDELREVVKWTPLDRLLVETDCPYLSPQRFRGKRNEPAYVVYVAEKVAEVKGLSFDEVAEATTRNAYELFSEW